MANGKKIRTDDEIIAAIQRCKTPTECSQFAENLKKHGRNDLVSHCIRREAELLAGAAKDKPANDVELRILTSMKTTEKLTGKRMSYTWRMIPKHGIVGMVERVVSKTRATSSGLEDVRKLGLLDLSFEAIILDNPALFSQTAIDRSRERLPDYRGSA